MIVWVAAHAMEYEGYGTPTLWSTAEKAKAWIDEIDPPKSKAKKRQWIGADVDGSWVRFTDYGQSWEVFPLTLDDPEL